MHASSQMQIVTHKGKHTSTHTLAKSVCRELAKMSSYVHGCLLSTPLSLFHSSTWWWQSAQRRDSPREGAARREERRRLHPSPRQQTLPVLSCQSNSALLNFTLNRRRSSPCQSLRDFGRSTKAKEHNEWKAPSQIDFKLNQTLVFNYLPELPLRNFKVVKGKERKKEKEGGESAARERGRSEQNANDSIPAWCQNRWPSGSAGADEWAVEVEPIATSS